jgi:hypothetical protein
MIPFSLKVFEPALARRLGFVLKEMLPLRSREDKTGIAKAARAKFRLQLELGIDPVVIVHNRFRNQGRAPQHRQTDYESPALPTEICRERPNDMPTDVFRIVPHPKQTTFALGNLARRFDERRPPRPRRHNTLSFPGRRRNTGSARLAPQKFWLSNFIDYFREFFPLRPLFLVSSSNLVSGVNW